MKKVFLPISSTSQGCQRGSNSALRNSFFMSHFSSKLEMKKKSVLLMDISINQWRSTGGMHSKPI
jgi:hypothetical protein